MLGVAGTWASNLPHLPPFPVTNQKLRSASVLTAVTGSWALGASERCVWVAGWGTGARQRRSHPPKHARAHTHTLAHSHMQVYKAMRNQAQTVAVKVCVQGGVGPPCPTSAARKLTPLILPPPPLNIKVLTMAAGEARHLAENEFMVCGRGGWGGGDH